MKKQAITMGMPATIMLADTNAKEPIRQAQGKRDIEEIFQYFQHIDEVFSTYKTTSEISQINNGLLPIENASEEVHQVLHLCEKANKKTNGYFSIQRNGKIDPLGMVKGYAIYQGAKKLLAKGYKNFYVEIAGDIEVIGKNEKGEYWRVGIENPFNRQEIIKVMRLKNCGIATSGNYKQGKHIYNPIAKKKIDEIVSITVIAKNVQEADILATAAFAMGEKGIVFLENLPSVEGYMIRKDKTAIMTSGFNKYVQ